MPTVAHIIRRRQNRKRRRSQATRRSAFWSLIVLGIPLALVMTPALGALALSLWLYLSAASLMPEPHETLFPGPEQGKSRFYDATDQTLLHTVADPLGDQRRWLPLEDLPPQLLVASKIASGADQQDTADAFDPAEALLQVWRYILGLPLEREHGVRGDFVRDTVLPLTRSSGLDARLLEIVLLAESKRLHSAEKLLEWRLNTSYYGHDAFGIEAAAQVYFGKPAAALSLAESALLAPIVVAPSLNPIDAPAMARERGANLLFQMLEAELINQAEFDNASLAEVAIKMTAARRPAVAPVFIKYARQQAEHLLDSMGFSGASLMARGALRITTTLDMTLHLQAECVLRAHLQGVRQIAALDGSPCDGAESLVFAQTADSAAPDTGALTLIDVERGRILTMVGEAEAAQPSAVGRSLALRVSGGFSAPPVDAGVDGFTICLGATREHRPS